MTLTLNWYSWFIDSAQRLDEVNIRPMFYENPERHAFTVELFFMTERYKQMQSDLQSQDMFNDFILSDYTFIKTLLFARKNLGEEEFKLFQMLYTVLSKNLPNPDLLVYFHRNVDYLMENIAKRGRSYESKISTEYLQNIQDSYFEYFRNILSYPILIIDLQNIDFVESVKNYEIIKSLLSKKYKPGVHRISLSI